MFNYREYEVNHALSSFQRAIDEVRTLITPNSPKRWLKKRKLSVLLIKFKFNRIKSATKFLCVKTSIGKVVVRPWLI